MSKENTEGKKPGIVKEIISWGITLGLAYLLGMAINNYVLLKARIPSNSMENTLMTGDHLFGFRLAYLFSEPERGDIVIFEPEQVNTEGTNFQEGDYYVKRIIGLPGETVEIIDGKVYIWQDETGEDKLLLEEPYLKDDSDTRSYGTFEVPEGCYFLLGDNRFGSYDSRKWVDPYLEKERIRSKAWLRYKPELEFIEHCEY